MSHGFSYVLIFLSLLIVVMTRHYGCKGRGFDARILINVVFLWVLLYGVIFPSIALQIDYSMFLLHQQWYGVSSVILAFFFFVFISCSSVLLPKYQRLVDPTVVGQLSFFVLGLGLLLFLGFWSSSQYRANIYSILILPSLMAIYCKKPDSLWRWILLVVIHAVVGIVVSTNDFVYDSKERIVALLIFPPLTLVVFGVHNKRARWLGFLIVVAAAILVGWAASSIVQTTRSNNTAETEGLLASERLLAGIERLAVVDGLSAAVSNELDSIPRRPSSPEWAMLGFIGQLGPSFYERPNHAREALSLTGYVTSHSDVNIALTVPGHFLWSLGWLGMAFGCFLFWIVTLTLIRASAFLGNSLSSIFYFFLLSQIPRLESVGYAFFTSIFTAFLFYSLLKVAAYFLFSKKYP